MNPRATLAGISIGGDAPVRIFGVVNTGPGSFYGPSVVRGRAAIRRRARAQVAAGADVVDVGARSTAPYLQDATTPDEEAELLAKAVSAACAAGVPVSADTVQPAALQAAVAAGATIANDESGLSVAAIAGIVAEHRLGLVVMAHPNGQPYAIDPLATVISRIEAALAAAERAGISLDSVIVDPGIGFFRQKGYPWYEWDAVVLRSLGRIRSIGRPVLVGVSRKSFIGAVLEQPDPADRLAGSLAATAIAVANGAAAIRTHDVRPTRDAARLAAFLRP